MANINKKKTGFTEDKNTTLNHEGMVVHKLNALEEIFNRTMGSYMGESGFYDKTSPEKDFDRIKELLSQVSEEDAEYVLKIAAIARETGMISYPLAILTACFNNDMYKGNVFADANGKNKMPGYVDLIVRRGRDITDILAMQMECYGFDSVNGKRTTPIPMQEKKNLRRKLEEFDEYKISKALGKSRNVSMADAVKLLRPGNKNEFFKQVIEGNVKFANGKKQVQSELTKVNNKNSQSTKEDVKVSIADSSLLAIVKNLVALVRQDVLDDETTDTIVKKLSNREVVNKSKVMPYELYSAYKALSNYSRSGQNIKKIVNALVKAIDFSVDNVDDIDGYSAILVDLSGSMDKPVSAKSTLTCKEMAALLAAIALKKSTARVFAFAVRCEEVDANSASTVIDIMQKILSKSVGGGTYLMEALKYIERTGDKFDNLITLSDGDAYSYDKRYGLRITGGYSDNCDGEVSRLIKNKVFKMFFINNLYARDFTVVNTDDYRKNLVTGFTERYIDEINYSIMLHRESADIRKLIDILYNKYFPVKTVKKSAR